MRPSPPPTRQRSAHCTSAERERRWNRLCRAEADAVPCPKILVVDAREVMPRASSTNAQPRSIALRLPGQAGRGLLDAAAPDVANRPQGADVVQRVAVDKEQVGSPARCDDAAVGEAEVPGGQYGRGAERVDSTEAGVDKQFQLV